MIRLGTISFKTILKILVGMGYVSASVVIIKAVHKARSD